MMVSHVLHFLSSKHSYVSFSTNNPVLLDISVCFLPSANLNLASVAQFLGENIVKLTYHIQPADSRGKYR